MVGQSQPPQRRACVRDTLPLPMPIPQPIHMRGDVVWEDIDDPAGSRARMGFYRALAAFLREHATFVEDIIVQSRKCNVGSSVQVSTQVGKITRT